jgi:hypothetical protein
MAVGAERLLGAAAGVGPGAAFVDVADVEGEEVGDVITVVP